MQTQRACPVNDARGWYRHPLHDGCGLPCLRQQRLAGRDHHGTRRLPPDQQINRLIANVRKRTLRVLLNGRKLGGAAEVLGFSRRQHGVKQSEVRRHRVGVTYVAGSGQHHFAAGGPRGAQ